MEYIETSAYTNQNVANAVVYTLRTIMDMTKKGYVLQKHKSDKDTGDLRKAGKKKHNRDNDDCPC